MVAPLPPGPSLRGLERAARPYMVHAASLAPASGSFPGEPAVELYHLHFEQVTPAGLSSILVQRVYQIRAAPALFVLDDVWYDSSRTRFHLVHADVLRQGRVLPGRDGGNLRPGATGNQPRKIDLPVLRAGDRVALEYALMPNSGPAWSLLDGHYLGNLFAFRDAYPTVRARFVLRARQRLAVAQAGLAPPVESRSPSGFRTWAWSAADQPAFFYQSGGPSLTDASPFVQVSGFSSWGKMATWYSDVLARRARLSPGFERQLAADVQAPPGWPQLNQNPAAVRATVNRVWRYLRRRLDYRGDESGVHAYVPAPVEQVFQAERGDCKDGALLLTTWLRALGVDADVALVRTPAMGRLIAGRGAARVPATVAAFDHALVYIPAIRQWIDTTAPALVPGELPSSDQDSLALIVRAGQATLTRVPAAMPAANFTRRTVQLVPDGQGWFEATGALVVRGADAPRMRRQYANRARRAAVLQAWLGRYFAAVRVQSATVTGVAPARNTVRVDFAARLRRRRPTVAWIRRDYAATMASLALGGEPFDVPLRWKLDETWRLRLSGACVGLAPPPDRLRASRFGALSISVSCQSGWLQVRSEVAQTARRVTPAEYGAYHAFWREVDADLNAPVRLPHAPRPQLLLVRATP